MGTDADYEAALSAYADHIPPRDQVPSTREVDAGITDYAFRPPPPPPKLKREPIRKRILADLKLLDPRNVATPGTMFPLLVLSGLGTTGQFDELVFRAMLPFIKLDMGFDFQFMFSVLGLMSVVTTLSAPVVGYVADRIKRVHMVRVGSIIDNASSIVTALAPNPLTLALSRVLGSFGPAIQHPAAAPLLFDYFPVERRARALGFQHVASLLWGMLSSFILMIGVFLTGWLTWRQLLAGAGATALIISVLTFWLKEPVRGEVDRLSMGVSKEKARKEQNPVSWTEAWRVCKNIGTLRKLWYATPFLEVGNKGLSIFLFFAMLDKFGGQAQGAFGFGAIGGSGFFQKLMLLAPVLFLIFPLVIQVAMTPFAIGLADRLMRHKPGRIMYYTGILTAAQAGGTALILLSPNPLLVLPVNFAVGALTGLVGPARGLLMSTTIPARVRGQGFQTIAPFQFLGTVIFAMLGGLADAYGAYTAAFMLIPVVVTGALILMSSGANVERDIANALAASLAEEETQAARGRGQAKMVVVRKAEVSYEGTQVLFDVDFDVEDGELVAVLGTNGAGKSTLLKAISGIHEVSGGAVFLDGEDITHKPPYLNARDGIVFLPGGRAIFPTLTVEENLRAAAWLYREDQEYVSRRSEEVLEFFPALRGRLHQHAGDLSGGEQQMLGLGQAFLMRPRLLMIDELSLGLAPQIVERLVEIVREIHAQGTTVVLVEQSVNVAVTIAPRAVFMDRGRVLFDGPTTELLQRGDLVRAAFLGSTGGSALVGVGRTKKQRYGEAPERVLEVDDVRVGYGGVQALDGVGLDVHAGEVVGIIGPNGAGKTTLFDVISGFVEPESGIVSIASQEATRLPPDARARLGLARSFQDTRLFPSLTVRETIATALERRVQARNPILAAVWAPAIRKAERRVYRRVEYLIDLLNLGAYADKFLSELSTGTRRMVDVACVVAAEPKILLLDEPSSGMAQAEVEVLGPLVQRLGRETGSGILVIEHDLPLVTKMSDRLVAMDLGRVIASGTPDEVVSDRRVMSSYLSASDTAIKRTGVLRQALSLLGGGGRGAADGHPAVSARRKR